MLKRIVDFLCACASPFVMIFGAAKSIIFSVIRVLTVVPANVLETLSSVLLDRTQKMNEAMDKQKATKQEKRRAEQLDQAVTKLLFTKDYLSQEKVANLIKMLVIVAFEVVSLSTTYRGIFQCFSQLGSAVPAVFAFGIQLMLIYLSSNLSNHHAPKSQRVLLAVFLAASLCMSYVGISEHLMPYKEYIGVEYSAYSDIYNIVSGSVESQTENSSDPTAHIRGQYQTIALILNEASQKYNAEELEELESNRRELLEKTIPTTVTNNSYAIRDKDGNIIGVGGGGTQVVYVTDPNAEAEAAVVQEEIDFIEELMITMSAIESLLQGECSEANVVACVEAQMSSDELLSEFTYLCTALETLEKQCNTLATEMGSQLNISFELDGLWQGYRDYTTVTQLIAPMDFSELVTAWEDSKDSEDNDESTLPYAEYLDSFTNALPTVLKDMVEQEVDDSYHSLRIALNYIGATNAVEMLDKAYTEFEVQHPYSYAFGLLSPQSTNFSTAVIALIIALFNDGAAILVGLLISPPHPNWFSQKTLTARDLVPYNYSQFKAIMMTCISKRLKGNDVSCANVYAVFSQVIEDFLAQFSINSKLAEEGFGRYARLSDLNSPENERLTTFMLEFGMARIISMELAHELGFAAKLSGENTKGNDGYVVLSSRAELWLMDILGTAAETIFHENTEKVFALSGNGGM